MSGITITRADVEAAITQSPWDLRKDFDADISLENIDSLSRIFKNGAGEAEESGSVSEYASDLTERAGTRGSNAIYEDAAAHLEETYDELGAEALEQVSSVLSDISARAGEVIDYNTDAIEAEYGMDHTVTTMSSRANEEYQNISQDLDDFLETTSTPDSKFTVTVGDQTFSEPALGFDLEPVRTAVKKLYVDSCAEVAETIAEAMVDEIDDYYALLTKKEGDLADLGYNVDGSPVNIWNSDGRAAYEGEQLRLELEKENPDAARVEKLTERVEQITEDLFDENGQPVASMTAAERAYLAAYMDGLGKEGLVLLGDENPAFPNASEIVANGLTALYNPDVGGFISTDNPQSPAAVRELLYDDIGANDAPGFSTTIGIDENGNIVIDGLDDYAAFTNLLNSSTVDPGASFSREVGESSLRVQQQFNAIYDDYQLGFLEAEYAGGGRAATQPDDSILNSFRQVDTGATDALEFVNRTTEGSQEFLGQDENLEALMAMDWYNDSANSAAVDVLNTATERAQDTPQEAHRAAQIAYNAMTMIGEDPVTWRAMLPKGDMMSDALVDIAGMYIDAFSAEGDSAVNEIPPGFDNVMSRDGQYFGSFMFSPWGSEGSSGLNFLDFVGMGNSTVEDFMTDTDFHRLNEAAQEYSRGEMVYAIENGSGFGSAEQQMGRIYGNLAYGEAVSALNFTQNEHEADVLLQERKDFIIDTVSTIAGNPAGQAIDQITDNKTLKQALKDGYSSISGEVTTAISEASASEGKSVEEVRGELVENHVARSQFDLNYTILEALDQAEGVSPTNASGLYENGELVSRAAAVKDQGMRQDLNDAIEGQEVPGASAPLRDDRSSGLAEKYGEYMQHYNPEAYTDVDRELVNRAQYGGESEGGEFTRRVIEVENHEWKRPT